MSLFGEIGSQEFSTSLGHSILNSALRNLHGKLSEFAMQSNYLSQMKVAFGSSLDTDQALALANNWLKRNADSFPSIAIVSPDILHGANGAFSHSANTIYLSNEFLAGNASSIDELTGLLLEEYGHYVDTRVNKLDAPGDEGDIFARLALGYDFNEHVLLGLKAENDLSVIHIQGYELPVEMSTSLSTLFSGGSDFRVDSRVFDTNTNSNMHFIAFARDSLSSFVRVGGYYYAYYIRGADVGLALTSDGVNFIDRGTVLRHDPNIPSESNWNSFPSVWKDGNRWYMVTEAIGKSQPGAIALAESSDGISWTKGGLILQKSLSWERANVGTPYLVKRGTEWFLYYHGFNGTDVQIGVARGTNLRNLTKQGNPIIETSGNNIFGGQAGKRSIIEDGGTYYMVYEVSSDKVGSDPNFDRSNYSSTVASSTDLINWQPLGRAVLPTSYETYGQYQGYASDGPEWFRTPDGNLHIYYRIHGNDSKRATLIALPAPSTITLQSETQFYHQIGRRDADGWSVNVLDTPGRFMNYGPYTTSVQGGNKTASFKLMLDNVTADNRRILSIDVYDATSGAILARRDITRRQFNRAFTYQNFNLNFNAISGHQLEFRTFWHGYSYVRQDNVSVR